MPFGLRNQLEPALAGRGGLQLVEADWPAQASETMGTGEGRMAVRLQLLGSQAASATKTDGTVNLQAAVCLMLADKSFYAYLPATETRIDTA